MVLCISGVKESHLIFILSFHEIVDGGLLVVDVMQNVASC